MQNFVGQQIDRYRIIERLGMGGMAVVYKAYDTRLEREVAIKIIRTDEIPLSQHERLMQRFEREAKAQARFSHPNIVPVHDYGEVNESPYLVMEYIRGGTLKERIHGPVDWRQAIYWLLPVADALQYAHERHIIHRDVKPSNILFGENDRPLLTDFGIAKLLEIDEATLTGTGLGVGTPEYMAPEQWQGKASPATDQYALGVVLYELLTGQKPYTADTPVAVALMQMTEPLRAPSQLVKGIPEPLEKVFYKALARDPQDRYEDMAALRAALESQLKVKEDESNVQPEPVIQAAMIQTTNPALEPNLDNETVDVLEATQDEPNLDYETVDPRTAKDTLPTAETPKEEIRRTPKWVQRSEMGFLILSTLSIILIIVVRILSGSVQSGLNAAVEESVEMFSDAIEADSPVPETTQLSPTITFEYLAMRKAHVLEQAASYAKEENYQSSISTILDEMDSFTDTSDLADLQSKLSEYSDLFASQILSQAALAEEGGISEAISIIEDALIVVETDSLKNQLVKYKTIDLFAEITVLESEGSYEKIIIKLRETISELGELPELTTKLTDIETIYRDQVLAETDQAIDERNVELAQELVDEGLRILPGDEDLSAKEEEIPGFVEVVSCYYVLRSGSWPGTKVAVVKCKFRNNTYKHVKTIEYTYFSYDERGFPMEESHKISVGLSSDWITDLQILPKETVELDVSKKLNYYINFYGILLIQRVSFFDETSWINPKYESLMRKFYNRPLDPLKDYQDFYTPRD